MVYSIPVHVDPVTYFSLRSAAQIETLRHGFAHENSRKIDHIMDVPGLAVPDTEAGQGTGSSGRSSWPLLRSWLFPFAIPFLPDWVVSLTVVRTECAGGNPQHSFFQEPKDILPERMSAAPNFPSKRKQAEGAIQPNLQP